MIAYALFFLPLVAVAGRETGAYRATDLYLLNCGATSDDQSLTGRTWSAENRKFLPSNSETASFSSKATVQDSSVGRVPYMTARIFRTDFTYSFTVSRGWKFVRLYFYPTGYPSDFDAVTSFFSVTVNGFSLMRNFSAYLAAAALVPESKTLVKEFIVPVLDSDRTLNLTFTPSRNSPAFVNGVEIVSMPDDLYTNGGSDRFTNNVDSDIGSEIHNMTALETVYRLNVGGTAVADVNDTGMFRQWVPDDPGYILGAATGQTPFLQGVRVKYTQNTPAYVAPEKVYTTYRTMGNAKNPLLNLNFNLTWFFTVDAGFNYLIRLHFCETMQEVTGPNQRVFSIFIRNRTAVPDADVIRWSGGSDVPVFRDFVTLVAANDGSRDGRRGLLIDLHPYMDSKPVYADVILNGVEILKLNNSEGSLAGPNPELTKSPESIRRTPEKIKDKRKSHVTVITLAVVGCTLGLTPLMVLAVLFTRHRKRKKTNDTNAASSLPTDLCRRFSFAEITSATDDFDDKLIIGGGGFGNVYRGRIDGVFALVAIKRLGSSSDQGTQEFETEVKMLSMLRHVHLVSLIGYCNDQNEMILVYEYMPLGTLRDHLYKNGGNAPLPWKQRLEICIGAARGLQYLHTGSKYPIIHRDIKSTNILLDENYVAKVSDFGLSRVGPTSTSQTHVTTAVKGSLGYLDPEYYLRQHLTEKSDVYSFGVVLFEVLCGRAVNVQGVHKDQVNLTKWAKLNHSRGTVNQIMDPTLTDDITPTSMDKFCEIAVRSVGDRATERPTMNDVVWALEFALQLHGTAKKNKNVDGLGMDLIKADKAWLNSPRGEMGTTDEDDDLFSESAGHASMYASTDDKSHPNLTETD